METEEKLALETPKVECKECGELVTAEADFCSICSECEAVIGEDIKFCPECGQKLIIECPNCGQEVTSEVKFCSECGEEIDVGEDKTN